MPLVLGGCGGSGGTAPEETATSAPTPTPLPRLANPDAYLDRGIKLMDAGAYESAIADFTAGLKLAPDHKQLSINRAAAYRLVGRTADAQADVDRLVALGEDRATVELLVSLAQRR